MYVVNDNAIKTQLIFLPHAAPCYNYAQENVQTKKTAWLVPHVIKHREGSEIISWRCNWGSSCEAECIYAMAKVRNHILQMSV